MNETRNNSDKEHIFSIDYAETLTLNLRLSTLSNLVARLHLVVKGKFSYHLLSYGNIKLSMKTNVFHIALVFLKGLEVLRHYEHKIDYNQKCEKDEHVHFWG